jgi:hypothetical protein
MGHENKKKTNNKLKSWLKTFLSKFDEIQYDIVREKNKINDENDDWIQIDKFLVDGIDRDKQK